MRTYQKDDLVFMLTMCRNGTNSVLRDITEEESLRRVDGYPNHIRWEAGHMARGISQILQCLTDELNFPVNWTELFSRSSIILEDSSDYPSLGEIKAHSDNLYVKLFETLTSVDDAKLEEEVQIFDTWKAARVRGALFLCMHDFYHAGQITVLRRALGKEGTFG